jgi:hypothetical protein
MDEALSGASIVEGTMAERLRLERELAELGLREGEHENGGTSAREVAVGTRIVLDPFPGLTVTDVVWTIPGTVVKTYWGDRKGSQLKALTAADRTKQAIAFHWVDAGDGRDVFCAARFGPYHMPLLKSFRFDVKAPRLDRFDAETSAPRIVKERGLTGLRFQGMRKKTIRVGGTSRTIEEKVAGIRWDWQVTLPARHGGFLKDLQLVRQGRRKRQLLSERSSTTRTLVLKHPRKAPADQLDQPFTDAGSDATYSAKGSYPPAEFPLKLAAGATFNDDSTFDRPHTALEKLDVEVIVDEPFKYFILYKPDTVNAIWVPIAKAEWFWKATAKRSGSAWKLVSKSGGVSARGAVTTEFPLYDSNVNENEWMDV